ncbi:hypothetical protein PIROE2DRAFT_18364 [Piromyces sp. E2]|nr:hypothetical protein PIROE2DRAFT_18364 [Piromyces sp. E2]|eukprot:OUM56854.1 hypothetical protein PIROE2DRAFT_18364 [Piromyces sp. E2]
MAVVVETDSVEGFSIRQRLLLQLTKGFSPFFRNNKSAYRRDWTSYSLTTYLHQFLC